MSLKVSKIMHICIDVILWKYAVIDLLRTFTEPAHRHVTKNEIDVISLWSFFGDVSVDVE